MKYRRLTTDELTELQPEFIRFLASQAIPSQEWEQLKKEKPDTANELIDIFSDLVFDKILSKVEFLELKTPKDFRTLHCGESKMTMLGFLIEGESPLDLTENRPPQEMFVQLQQSSAKLKVFRGEKAYKNPRNEELFEWMEQGALISKDGQMYKTLEELVARN